MAYSKNAFVCAKCPGKAGENGCPMYWDTVMTNAQTGEVKAVRGCGFEQLPVYLVEVIKAANRPAAAIETTRNVLAEGLARLHGLQNGMPLLGHREDG